jgi:hypothetical protein
MLNNRKFAAATTILLALATLTGTGCTTLGPYLGFLSFPIPVSPYFQKKKEDEFSHKERYDRVPILGPVTSGGPPVALDPPSDDEIMRALEKTHKVQGGFPFLHEVQRNNVRITKELIADYVDPVRFYPAVGPAQLHHAHYKCTVYFEETTRVGWPSPHTLIDEDSREVIYIDHNHLHMVKDAGNGVGTEY